MVLSTLKAFVFLVLSESIYAIIIIIIIDFLYTHTHLYKVHRTLILYVLIDV